MKFNPMQSTFPWNDSLCTSVETKKIVYKIDIWPTLDRGQTREICEKQENYFKGKVVTFTVQSLLLYQYPADLLTFFELY